MCSFPKAHLKSLIPTRLLPALTPTALALVALNASSSTEPKSRCHNSHPDWCRAPSAARKTNSSQSFSRMTLIKRYLNPKLNPKCQKQFSTRPTNSHPQPCPTNADAKSLIPTTSWRHSSHGEPRMQKPIPNAVGGPSAVSSQMSKADHRSHIPARSLENSVADIR